MIYANDTSTGKRIEATPNSRGACPSCGGELISKCGEINTWHWSHTVASNCEYKHMSEWHIRWQSKFPDENLEIYVKDGNGHRIADVKLNDGTVLEFQHSSISVETIRDRERVHDKLIWIFDATHKSSNLEFYFDRFGKTYLKWNWMPKTILHCDKTVLINIKDNILYNPRADKFYTFDVYRKDEKMLNEMSGSEIIHSLIEKKVSLYSGENVFFFKGFNINHNNKTLHNMFKYRGGKLPQFRASPFYFQEEEYGKRVIFSREWLKHHMTKERYESVLESMKKRREKMGI